MKLKLPCFHKKPSRSTIKSPAASSSRNKSLPRGVSKSSSSSPNCGVKRASWGRLEIWELKEAFKVFDANGDGKISATELGFVMRKLGGDKATDQEAVQMVKEADKDGDGFVSLEEFVGMFCWYQGAALISEADLREAFLIFDADKNGYISAEELFKALKPFDNRCTLQDCLQMIQRVDEDGDGHVSFQEFHTVMAS